MPISSLILKTKSDETNDVVNSIEKIQQAEVSEVHGDNIIVITDTEHQDQDKSIWKKMEALPGVLKCDLIYHNFEDQEEF